MIESYLEADRYWVVTGSEAHIAANDSQTQALIRDYARLRDLLPQKPPGEMDTDLADVAVADKLMRRIRARYPAARLGAELIFRGGQLRALDAVLPKDIWLMNMGLHSRICGLAVGSIRMKKPDFMVHPRSACLDVAVKFHG
jgi:hypothetical protein